MFPLTFAPFDGASYRNQYFKILTLGESHYFGEEDMALFHKDRNDPKVKNITQNVVHQFLDYKRGKGKFYRWMNTFTKYANALQNKELTAGGCADIWESMVFYNFVQTPMTGPRVSPTQEDFKRSRKAFEEVLADLSPNLIIFWGKRLWNNFEKDNYSQENGINYLEYNGKKYPFLVIPHPSSTALNYKVYGEIQQYIQKIK